MVTQAQTQGLGVFANFKFTLYCPDDHTVALLHEGRSIAIFRLTGATEESIQEKCCRHLALKHGWEGCLWSRKEKTHGESP